MERQEHGGETLNIGNMDGKRKELDGEKECRYCVCTRPVRSELRLVGLEVDSSYSTMEGMVFLNRKAGE